MFNRKKKAAAAAEAEQTAALQARLDSALVERDDLEQRITVLDQANAHLDARLAALDQGIGAISEELVKLSSASAATNQLSRRTFLQTTAAATGAAGSPAVSRRISIVSVVRDKGLATKSRWPISPRRSPMMCAGV